MTSTDLRKWLIEKRNDASDRVNSFIDRAAATVLTRLNERTGTTPGTVLFDKERIRIRASETEKEHFRTVFAMYSQDKVEQSRQEHRKIRKPTQQQFMKSMLDCFEKARNGEPCLSWK